MSYQSQSPESMPLCAEQVIRDRIAELKAKLPQMPHEPSEPVHAVVSKVFPDGANHTRTVDLANDWKRVGGSIRDAVKQGGEVVLRPLYAGEEPKEKKDYPSTKRIRELEALVERVARLRPEAGEIGPGMLASLVEEARGLMSGKAQP